jgi:hypothetical protein
MLNKIMIKVKNEGFCQENPQIQQEINKIATFAPQLKED